MSDGHRIRTPRSKGATGEIAFGNKLLQPRVLSPDRNN
jgi:hypothetical protein